MWVWLSPGEEIEVNGLIKRPELNGVRGKVLRHIPAKGRWEVELSDGHGVVALKPGNITSVSATTG